MPLVVDALGVVAVFVSQSIVENGQNSWTALPAWAGFAAVAALATLLPWAPLPARAREGAWRAAGAGVGALALVWVLFVLPTIHRSVAFVYTVATAACAWAVWSAPGRPPRAS